MEDDALPIWGMDFSAKVLKIIHIGKLVSAVL